MSERPHLVLVGGFLGAGKTTLILAAARELASRGLRSAAVLNDQGDDLIDTQHVRTHGIDAREVTGGCFCCRFSDLVDRAEELRAYSPDVIFAEPVGSCTDISSTTLKPLARDYGDHFRLAPFTVLVDPERARALLDPGADEDLAFLFRKQLEEADLICLTKSDLHAGAPALPYPNIRQLSAKSGQGVAAWLDETLDGRLAVGAKTLDIDYGEYARAETALAWMNLTFVYDPEQPMSAPMVVGPLLDGIDSRMTAMGIAIVHLKITDESAAGFLKAAICANGADPTIDGALDASPATLHEIRLNLRAKGSPDDVELLVEDELRRLPGTIREQRMACFRPGAPVRPAHAVR